MICGYDSDDNDALNAFSSSSPPVNVLVLYCLALSWSHSKPEKGVAVVAIVAWRGVVRS